MENKFLINRKENIIDKQNAFLINDFIISYLQFKKTNYFFNKFFYLSYNKLNKTINNNFKNDWSNITLIRWTPR